MPKRPKVPEKPAPSDDELKEAIEKCLERVSSPKEAPYLRVWFFELLRNHAVPFELLEQVPVRAQEAGKTRFDQLYDAAVAIVFPGYTRGTLERLLGPSPPRGIRIWRVILPERYKVPHVLIRAESYGQAFALGCDYACRVSLRLYGKIPIDLTIKVIYMTERALRRHLNLRWANRTSRRRKLKLEGREFTSRQLNGVRLFAMGSPRSPLYSIARYCETKDLDKIRLSKGLIRASAVEAEPKRRRNE
jgi:hypothetical protein